jgi:hypothetical protein
MGTKLQVGGKSLGTTRTPEGACRILVLLAVVVLAARVGLVSSSVGLLFSTVALPWSLKGVAARLS